MGRPEEPMTIRNLGSIVDFGHRLEKSDLDRRIDDVLDWLDGTGFGLGEVIDRMQHLHALRAIIAEGAENPFARRAEKMKAAKAHKIDPCVVKQMRFFGMSYREISKSLQCSVGLAHRLAHEGEWGNRL